MLFGNFHFFGLPIVVDSRFQPLGASLAGSDDVTRFRDPYFPGYAKRIFLPLSYRPKIIQLSWQYFFIRGMNFAGFYP